MVSFSINIYNICLNLKGIRFQKEVCKMSMKKVWHQVKIHPIFHSRYLIFIGFYSFHFKYKRSKRIRWHYTFLGPYNREFCFPSFRYFYPNFNCLLCKKIRNRLRQVVEIFWWIYFLVWCRSDLFQLFDAYNWERRWSGRTFF